jgi:hypothetical protein
MFGFIRKHSCFAICFLLISFLYGCAYPKNFWEKNIKEIDRAFEITKMGDDALDEGDYSYAIEAYSRAVLINPTFLPAHEGRIKLSLKTGLILNGLDALDDAYKYMEMYDVLGTDKNRWKFKTYEVRLILEQKSPFWYSKIRKLYDEEVQREPNVNYYEDFLVELVYASLAVYEKKQSPEFLQDATDLLEKLKKVKTLRETEIETLRDKVKRLGASEDIDKITKSEMINNISRAKTVNKLDMAIMLDQILDIKKFLPDVKIDKPVEGEVDENGGSDYSHLGFAQMIREINRYKLPYLRVEEGAFDAPRTLKRREFADVMMAIVVKKTGNMDLKRDFWKRVSPFSDISYLLGEYGSVMACHELGIMHAYPDGKFYPNRYITGVEAIQGFWALRALDVKPLLAKVEKKRQKELQENQNIEELKGDVIIIDEEQGDEEVVQ